MTDERPEYLDGPRPQTEVVIVRGPERTVEDLGGASVLPIMTTIDFSIFGTRRVVIWLDESDAAGGTD